MEWHPAGWSVCLPLSIFPCTMKSRSSLLAPAHRGGPGKRAIKQLWCGVVVVSTSAVDCLERPSPKCYMLCDCVCDVGVLCLNALTDWVSFCCEVATENSHFLLAGVQVCTQRQTLQRWSVGLEKFRMFLPLVAVIIYYESNGCVILIQ